MRLDQVSCMSSSSQSRAFPPQAQAPCFAGMMQSVLGSVGPRPWPHPTLAELRGQGYRRPMGSHVHHRRPGGVPLGWRQVVTLPFQY